MAIKYSIRQINKSRGNKTWYGCTLRDGGPTEQISLHTTNKQVALTWLHTMQSQALLPPVIQKSLKDIDISRACEDYRLYLHASVKQITYVTYTGRLKPCWKFFAVQNVNTLREITPNVLLTLVNSFPQDRRKTLRERYKALKAWLVWCRGNYDLADFEPWAKVKVKTPPPEPEKEFWTMEQLEKILAASPTDLHRLFLGLMVYAGLRYREALGLRWEDFDADLREFQLVGKMDRFDKLPVAEKLRALLLKVKTDSSEGRLFPPDKFPQASYELIALLRSVVRLAGLSDPGKIGHHKIRHSYATNLLRQSVDIKTVSRAMRHARMTTTMDVYCHTTDESVEKAVNLL